MEQTEEQRKRAFEDAGMPVIGADTLETAPTPIEPTEPVYSSVSTLPEYKPMELTEPEKEVSAAQKKIAELRSETLGESELRASLEERQDIETKRQTITDLEAEYGIIQAEARELAEQQRMIPLQLQEEAKGRGITVGGLRPLETGRLRQLAIRQGMVTSKGMFAVANLQAAQGNLNTALGLIDRAVEAEFAPKRERLNAEIANLNMLLQSPELALADQNRANAMMVQKEQEMAEVEAQAQLKQGIGEIGTRAALQGADAMVLREIKSSTSVIDAISIATANGISFGDEIDRIAGTTADFKTFNYLKETNQLPVGVNTYDEYVQRIGEIKRKPEVFKPVAPTLQPTEGYFDTKIESSVREDANQLLTEGLEKEKAFQTLRRLYSPQEATDTALRQIVGIPEPVVREPTVEDTAESWLEEIVTGEKSGFWSGLKELVFGDTTTEEKEQIKSRKEAEKDLKRLERVIKGVTDTNTRQYMQKQIDDIKLKYNL